MRTEPTDVKRCYACRESKPTCEFNRNRAKPDGLQTQCRACQQASETARRRVDPQAANEYIAAWKRANPQRAWQHRIKSRYGLTREQFERMLAEADNRCQVCRRHANLHIDHCHTHGHVRGLLCVRCNHVMHVVDQPDLLNKLIDYRDRHAPKEVFS